MPPDLKLDQLFYTFFMGVGAAAGFVFAAAILLFGGSPWLALAAIPIGAAAGVTYAMTVI